MRQAMLFEELILIAYRDKGNPIPGVKRGIDNGLAGAVLTELALADRIRVQRHDPRWFSPLKDLIRVTNPTPLGDPETDYALHRILNHHRAVHSQFWISQISETERYPHIKSMLRRRLLDRLVHYGTLAVHDHKVLGLFPSRRYPTVNPTIENDARYRLNQLIHSGAPDPRTATLLLLMYASTLSIFPTMPNELKYQQQRLREGGWATPTQCETINAIIAAVESMRVQGL